MAGAAERLQIVIAAKDEISGQIKATKADMTSLGRTADALRKRMEAGEQGVQNEYEQTRLGIEKNRQKLIQLGREAAQNRSEFRKLTTEGQQTSTRLARSFDTVTKKLGLADTATGKLRSSMSRLGLMTRTVGTDMDRTAKRSSRMSDGFSKMAGLAAGVTAAIAASAGAFQLLGSSINEARDARKALAQTAAVMRSMGRTEAPKGINKMIDQLADLAGIDDDEIRGMTNVLLTFGNVTGDTFETANALALDLSAAFGKDLQSSAVMVGKALNDPAKGLTALSRIGVQFTDQQTEQVKAMMDVGDIAGAQAIVIKELTRQVEGSAAAQADGIGRAQVAWGNLKEAIGETLLSTGSGLNVVKMLQQATKWIKQNKAEIVNVLQRVIQVVFTVISVFLKWQSVALKTFGYIIGGIASLLQAMAWLDPSMQGAADKARGLADGFGEASEKADRASKFFKNLADKSGDAAGETDRLKKSLENVGVAVDGLPAKKLNKLLGTTRIPGVNSQGGQVPGLWTGGPVTAGMTALVGEIGPELFVPTVGPTRVIGADGPELRDFHTSGVVIPNHLLAPVVSVSAPAGPQTVHSGATVTIGTVNATRDVDVEAAVLQATLRAERIARERR
jgi:hypothetical protein